MAERSRFYLGLAVAFTIVTFWGFSETYFAPLFGKPSAFGGNISDLPVIVHLHGWTFFLWYLLLPGQASLIAASNVRLHRCVGTLSVALVVVMTITGFIIIPVNVYNSSQPGAVPIWRFFGPAILATLCLFIAFYALALRNRRKPDHHKRYILIASAVGLAAATFRILNTMIGPALANFPAGILVTNLFIVVGMLRDRLVDGRVHRVYWIGVTTCIAVEVLFLIFPHTPLGGLVLDTVAGIGAKLLFFYD